MVRIAVTQRSVLLKGRVPRSRLRRAPQPVALAVCQGPVEHEMPPDAQKGKRGLHTDVTFASVRRSSLLRGFNYQENLAKGCF